jgi:hypothetical protein
MSFTLPISTIRSIVATTINTALSITDSADATYYPDRAVTQENIDKALDVTASSGGTLTLRVFFLITPGIEGNPDKFSTCHKYDAVIPCELTYCRRYDDNVHRKGSDTLLADIGAIANGLKDVSKPWAATLIKDFTLTEMTTRFPEAEMLNNAGYAAVRLGFNLYLELD